MSLHPLWVAASQVLAAHGDGYGRACTYRLNELAGVIDAVPVGTL